MKPSPNKIAALFGCAVEQARQNMLDTATRIRAYTDSDLKRWKKTREESLLIASDYESRAVITNQTSHT